MARLPNMARLAIGADAEASTEPPPPPPPLADASDLPPELWEKVLAAITKDEPCDEIVKLCALNRKWAGMCRDGSLYDAANRALGWYGKQGTWPNVLAVYAALMVDPPGDGTPKGYFQAACRALARWDWKTIAPWHPFYAPIIISLVRGMRDWHDPYTDPTIGTIGNVPPYHPDYEEIVRAFLDAGYYPGSFLFEVNREHPSFKRLALYAIDKMAEADGVAAPAVEMWVEGFHGLVPFYAEVIESVVRKYGWNALHWRKVQWDGPWPHESMVLVDENVEFKNQEFAHRMRELAGPYTVPLTRRSPPQPPQMPPPGGYGLV